MEHLFKGYAIAKIEYGGWGDSHPVEHYLKFSPQELMQLIGQINMDIIYLVMMDTQNMESSA